MGERDEGPYLESTPFALALSALISSKTSTFFTPSSRLSIDSALDSFLSDPKLIPNESTLPPTPSLLLGPKLFIPPSANRSSTDAAVHDFLLDRVVVRGYDEEEEAFAVD